jgi:hypothetical protein
VAKPYSWKKAALAAVVTAGLVLALGCALAFGLGVRDEDKFGEGIGRSLIFFGAFAYAMSYLYQTGRQRAAMITIGGLVVLIGLAIAALALTRPSGAVQLTAADRAAFVVEGDRWRHPTLGFSIQSPGASFHDAPKLAAMFGTSDEGMHMYAFTDGEGSAPGSAILVIGLMSGDGLVDNMAGLESGLGKVAAKQGVTITTVDRHVDRNEATLHDEFSGAHLRLHAYQRQLPDRGAFTVIVLVFGQDEHALAAVLESVR